MQINLTALRIRRACHGDQPRFHSQLAYDKRNTISRCALIVAANLMEDPTDTLDSAQLVVSAMTGNRRAQRKVREIVSHERTH